MFDKVKFEGEYKNRLIALQGHEKGVREHLNVLSRTVLDALHRTENIGYVNDLLRVLTPVNRKAAVIYFRHFTGFSYDETTKLFTKKSKKRYDAAHRESIASLEDPLFNLFSWAGRNIQMEHEAMPFDASKFKAKVKRQFDKTLQEAKDNGLTQEEIFSLLFKSEAGKVGVDVDAVIHVLESMDIVDVQHEPALM